MHFLLNFELTSALFGFFDFHNPTVFCTVYPFDSAQTLELGAVEESVLRDNVDILRANGFDFVFNDSG